MVLKASSLGFNKISKSSVCVSVLNCSISPSFGMPLPLVFDVVVVVAVTEGLNKGSSAIASLPFTLGLVWVDETAHKGPTFVLIFKGLLLSEITRTKHQPT